MKKILIADDSFFVKKSLTDILNHAGYKNIITASDGAEA
ncbi:MAG: chemotaxis protein CheV, partial [Candidatus Aenigmarchaeota archaeon CG01_land_8_20_14_3_00_37_9]